MIQNYPKAGEWGWANDVVGYGLPDGLPDRARIYVLKAELNDFLVEDEARRRWNLSRIQTDGGLTYWLDGQPYYESHPVAIHYLRHYLLEIESRLVEAGEVLKESLLSSKDEIRWQIQRHGIDPDAPLPPGPPPRFTGAPRRTLTGSPRAPQRFRPETGDPVRRMNS